MCSDLMDPDLMDSDSTEEPLPGLYTVRTRYHHHGDMTSDLAFLDAIRLIQDRFEQSNGAVYFASIERQEK